MGKVWLRFFGLLIHKCIGESVEDGSRLVGRIDGTIGDGKVASRRRRKGLCVWFETSGCVVWVVQGDLDVVKIHADDSPVEGAVL